MPFPLALIENNLFSILPQSQSHVHIIVETGSENPSSINDSSHIERLVSELENWIKNIEEENKENRKLLNNQSKQLENFQILLLNEQKKNKLLEDNIEEDQNQEKNAASHLHGLAKLMYYFKQNKKRQD